MFKVQATFEVLTGESAAGGDCDRSGWTLPEATDWEFDDCPESTVLTAREVFEFVRGGEASDSWITGDSWITVREGMDYHGEERSVSYHLDCTSPASARKHWARILRMSTRRRISA